MINENDNQLDILFKDNPCYKPFLGVNYKDILIIGESHYINFEDEEVKKAFSIINNKKITNEKYVVGIWGECNQRILDNEKIISNYYNTRKVVNNYFEKKKQNDFKRATFIYFRRIESALETLGLDLNNIAFMNYNQIPSLKCGSSIHKCYDLPGFFELSQRTNSIEIVKKVIGILNPKIVIVTAKKEYQMLYNDKSLMRFKIVRSIHPSCAWWNKKHGVLNLSGREYFIECLKECNNAYND